MGSGGIAAHTVKLRKGDPSPRQESQNSNGQPVITQLGDRMARLVTILGFVAIMIGVACVGDPRRTDEEIREIAGAAAATAIASLSTLTPAPTSTPQPTATPFTSPPTVIEEAKFSEIEAAARLKEFFFNRMDETIAVPEDFKKTLLASGCDPTIPSSGCDPDHVSNWLGLMEAADRFVNLAFGNNVVTGTYQGKGTWSFSIETVRGREQWTFFESGDVAPIFGPLP